MIRTILVPLDCSTFGEHALPMAAAVARKHGAKLHLALVHASGSWAMELAYLKDVMRRLAAAVPVAVEAKLLEGEVADELKGYARRVAADLVVMSTHGRGGFERLCLGSVADELTAALSIPVLLVRPGEGVPDLAATKGLRSIVVPLDGTPLAEKAIEHALDLGLAFGAEFTLARVNAPALLSAYVPEGAGAHSVQAILDEAEALDRRDAAEATRYLEAVADRMRARGATVRTHVVLDGRPATGILAEADADLADLIVIETHGRRGMARFFMGSVADTLVRGGDIPVLVHHAAP
jgi:nucleotide-binding universal stress UspA family protein